MLPVKLFAKQKLCLVAAHLDICEALQVCLYDIKYSQ